MSISTKPNPLLRPVSRCVMRWASNRAELGEHRLQVGLLDVAGEVAHVQILPHDRTPKLKADDPRDAFNFEKKGTSLKRILATVTTSIAYTTASASTAVNVTAATTILPLLGFVHDEPPSLVFEVIESLDC